MRGRASRCVRGTGIRLTRFAALAPKLSSSVDPSTLATGPMRTPYAAGWLADRKVHASRLTTLAREKVRMPRSSRGCSFFRCEEKSVALCRTEDGRVKTFAKKSGYHAAVPRMLRGATSGASGGDSPMSESSRTARRRSVGGFGTELRLGEGARYSDIRARWWCGCRARRDGESVRRADGRLQGAQFVCAPANRGPVGVAPTSTTTTLPPQPCRFTDGECRGQCGGDGVCSAAASSGSCECRTTPSGRTRPRATASAPTRARRASSISRARAACAFRRRGRSARRERSKRRETPLAAPPAGFIRGTFPVCGSPSPTR